jgi:PAS domain-containing protein
MSPTSTDLSANHHAGKHRFLKTAKQVSEAIGNEFFTLLVSELRETLEAKCVYIGEFVQGKTEMLRAVAARVGAQTPTFDFPLRGTPDAEVASGNPGLFTTGARELFPNHRLLADLAIEAFAGVRLNDSDGHPCGLIAALYSEPLDLDIYFVQAMLNAFVPRTAAELSRKRTDDALRESEERYRTFVQLNPDACWRIEFDEAVDTTLPEEEQLEKILRSGYVAEHNDALVRRLELKEGTLLIGANITEVLPDIPNIRRCVESLIRAEYRYNTIEVKRINSKGKRINFLHSHWGVVENGRLQRVWGSSRDITELREVEARCPTNDKRADGLADVAV